MIFSKSKVSSYKSKGVAINGLFIGIKQDPVAGLQLFDLVSLTFQRAMLCRHPELVSGFKQVLIILWILNRIQDNHKEDFCV